MSESETRGRAVARDEVQEAARGTVAVARDDHERVGLLIAAERVHGHREAALRRAREPGAGDALELGEVGLGQRNELARYPPSRAG